MYIDPTMRGNRYGLPFYVVTYWISFAFSEGPIDTVHTPEGCNVTLVCHQPGNVTWLDTGTSQKLEDPRFETKVYGSFSTLLITAVSENDAGNITCVGQERNITTSLQVCYDVRLSSECLKTILAGDPCNSEFMTTRCTKSCGLCPEPNCTELILPTHRPPSENPQTAVAHTDSSSTESSSSKASSPTQDTRDADKNSGATWSSGFQGLFALVSACFSIFVLLSQNIMTMPGWKLRRLTSSRQKYSRRAACLPKHPHLLKKVFRFLFHRK